jgi:hypothetical protein
VIDYTTANLAESAAGLDVVLETIAGDYPAQAVQIIKPGGVVVSTLPPSLAPAASEATARGVRLAGLFVEADRLGVTPLAELAADGRLVPAIAGTSPPSSGGNRPVCQERHRQERARPRLNDHQNLTRPWTSVPRHAETQKKGDVSGMSSPHRFVRFTRPCSNTPQSQKAES